MKTNLKSGNALVRLLLGHGEKIGILAIGICTALVIWSAIGRERLQREPSELDNLAKGARSNVTSFTWNNLQPEEKIIAEPVPESAMATIPPTAFPNLKASWDPAVADPVTLRTDPIMLAAQDLEAKGESGLWASADPAVIKRKMLEAAKQQKLEEQKREAARKRALEGQGNNRRGGGYGGEGMGFGGYGGEMGGYGGRGARGDRKPAKDAPIIQRPRSGAGLQGFEEITAKSWVTVVAKIPIDQQNQQYIDALRTSRGYNEQVDIPRYLGYQIDRAEVTGQGQGEWKQVAVINSKKLIEEISTYPVNVPDVIDRDVKHPILTHPLPPLILKEWDKRVSHSSMPLAQEKLEAEAKALEEPEEIEEPDESAGEEDMFAEADGPGRRGRGRGGEFGGRGRGEFGGGRGGYGGRGGEMGGYGGGMGGYGGEMGGYGGEMGGYGGEMGGYGGEMGGYGGYGGEMGGYGGYGGEMGGYGGEMGGYGGMRGSMGRGSDATLEQFVWDHETPHILFRYFDNTVTPGHSYRYRIRLVLRDVNHKVKEQYLDKTVSQRRQVGGNKSYRWTNWSEPSPVAGVPMPARIYMVSATPARETNLNDEPEVEILIKALNSQYAAEVARQASFSRGSVINVIDKASVITANKIDELDLPKFEFLTGITVLDFSGGEKLSSKNSEMVRPTRALLMDAAGHLYLQNEMDDLETLTEYQAIIETRNSNRRRGGGMRGGEMGGGYGGEMGGYGGEMGGYGGEMGGYGGER